MKLIRFNQLEPNYPTTFSGLLDRFFQDSIGVSKQQFSPAVDISEDEQHYEVQLAVPGMKKKDFHVELVDGKLTISGERKMEEKKEGKNFHSVETHYGSFSRSFFLPEDVDQENLQAQYEDGLLKIKLPKTPKKVQKASIEVK
ncbi:Hsp20/alpha crystallin family protein [Pararhodonellum marinum]|uniref:Hsp20/alpha crystallin family protein n=1 Tax=Pararhodonellum marinum TaxID=2755358 RepID=UPI00188E6FB3|nr:Hsp20/alpha crystallin family protein [Pararhodonellum marinum]